MRVEVGGSWRSSFGESLEHHDLNPKECERSCWGLAQQDFKPQKYMARARIAKRDLPP